MSDILGSTLVRVQKLFKDIGGDAHAETVAIAAGAEIVGQVSIDQTTPGTTNKVVAETEPIAAAAADIHAPAVNTAAVVTYAGVGAVRHCITGMAWSYDGGIPVGGNILVEDVAATDVFNIDITEEGPGFFIFPSPKRAAAVNTAMIITLAAGGAGVTGKLSVLNHWTE